MNSTGGMSYVYDALGNRHSKSYCVISPSGGGGGQYDYVDDFVFHNGTLEQVRFNGGFITLSGSTPQYHYFHTDHLGSVRCVTDASGNVEQRRSYYPFGSSFSESTSADVNRLMTIKIYISFK